MKYKALNTPESNQDMSTDYVQYVTPKNATLEKVPNQFFMYVIEL